MTLLIFKNGIQIWRYTASLILLTLVLQSCEKRKIEPIIDTFPMNQGSEWHYQRTLYVTVFESESSDLVEDVDTIQNSYKLWVAKDTVLNDTMYVTVFESFEKENVNYKSQEYYFLDEEGLKLYAMKGSSGAINLGKSAAEFNSVPAFSMDRFLDFLPPDQFSGLLYFIPPRFSLQLPLKEDSYWTCTQSNSSSAFRIDKKVSGTDLLKVGGTEFACFRVEWLYIDYFEDIDIHVTEWIASEGLIQRTKDFGRTKVVNLEGEYLYSAAIKEVLQLVDLNLN